MILKEGTTTTMGMDDQSDGLRSATVPRESETVVRTVLRKNLNLEAAKLVSISGRGATNEVVKVETLAGGLAVRLNRKTHFAAYQKEAWCLQHAHRQGIPVPTVIDCGIEGGVAIRSLGGLIAYPQPRGVSIGWTSGRRPATMHVK